ncbi:hypothetical protein B0H14DRAFT_3592249 [Mycena olivaceomarginata]|nr:hypothetical protein B0H14DRAFT_3592249 [Mycena olivaceomarginata]
MHPSRFALPCFCLVWDCRAEEWDAGCGVDERRVCGDGLGLRTGTGMWNNKGTGMRRKTRMRREAGRGGGGTRDAASGGWRGEAATDGCVHLSAARLRSSRRVLVYDEEKGMVSRIPNVRASWSGRWRRSSAITHCQLVPRLQDYTPPPCSSSIGHSTACSYYSKPLFSLLGCSGFALDVSALHPQHLAMSRYFRVYLAADGCGFAVRGAFICRKHVDSPSFLAPHSSSFPHTQAGGVCRHYIQVICLAPHAGRSLILSWAPYTPPPRGAVYDQDVFEGCPVPFPVFRLICTTAPRPLPSLLHTLRCRLDFPFIPIAAPFAGSTSPPQRGRPVVCGFAHASAYERGVQRTFPPLPRSLMTAPTVKLGPARSPTATRARSGSGMHGACVLLSARMRMQCSLPGAGYSWPRQQRCESGAD